MMTTSWSSRAGSVYGGRWKRLDRTAIAAADLARGSQGRAGARTRSRRGLGGDRDGRGAAIAAELAAELAQVGVAAASVLKFAVAATGDSNRTCGVAALVVESGHAAMSHAKLVHG